jgi:hypothetical protein
MSVISFSNVSSKKYKIFKEGKATIMRMKNGRKVQNSSISFISERSE